jgi:hypothetical protein
MTTIDRMVAEIKAAGISTAALIAALSGKPKTKAHKPKAISNQSQVDCAGPGIYRVKGAVGFTSRGARMVLVVGSIASASREDGRKWVLARLPT